MYGLDLPGWILWGIIAVVLLIVEMVSTAYVALGFAIAATGLGLLVWLVPGIPVMWQALIWAVLGLGVWLLLSRYSKERRRRRPDINDFNSLDSLPEEERHKRPKPPASDGPNPP